MERFLATPTESPSFEELDRFLREAEAEPEPERSAAPSPAAAHEAPSPSADTFDAQILAGLVSP